MPAKNKEHLLFLTGKLAEKRLHRVLGSMNPVEFSYEIRNIGVSVAALMTAQMLLRRLNNLDGIDRIIVPGMCRGDLQKVTGQFGLPVVRGPEDLKDLPVFFGRESKPPDLSRYDVRIFAEITDAPLLALPEIILRAEQFKKDGADIIDIGCLPDTPFPHLEEAINELRNTGYRVSVDSLEDDDLLRGGRAGADYLLSLKESTAWIADEVDSIPVLIPEPHTELASLYRLIETFEKSGKKFIADSILDPIHFGLVDSIVRYFELRKQFPTIDIMMGIGNLTELTEADTTGINSILFGLISELHIGNVLATEVSPHARSAVREADIARRIMYAAREEEGLPKGLDSSLLTTHARKPFTYSTEEIRELAADIRDPSYRVMVNEDGIHVFNRDGIHTANNPYDLFPLLKQLQDDAPHAFYLGMELAKAQIALQLGKRFIQDEELDWGVAGAQVGKSEQEKMTRAAHSLKQSNEAYKQAGTTLQAGKNGKKSRKKA
jgi:dihydropteroate synthase